MGFTQQIPAANVRPAPGGFLRGKCANQSETFGNYAVLRPSPLGVRAMNKFVCLIIFCLFPSVAGSQQPAAGQGTSIFGLPKSSIFSQESRPAWLGGTANNSSGPKLPNLFGTNKNGDGIRLPSDPDQQAEWFNSLAGQVQTLNTRLGQFDTDNQQLHSELASYRQKLQAAGDYNYQLKQQLTDSIAQLRQIQNDKLNLEQQLAAARLGGQDSGFANGQNGMLAGSGGAAVPSQLPGTAVLRANNSLLQQLPQLRIPGVTAQMDGDVIRVEVPSDPLFVPGSYQISNQHGAMLQEIASAINRSFPRQIVGIESHWDGTPIQPATTSSHQVTASQSLAVFDFLKQTGLPERQLFTMAMGSNRPRHPPGTANRRVEIVIYPEYWDGK